MRRSATFAAHEARTIRRADQRAQPQFAVFELRVAADRHLAAAFKPCVHGAFRAHAHGGFIMIERRKQIAGARIVKAALNTDGALADGRQRYFRREGAGDTRVELQTLKARDRQNNGVVLAVVEFAQARADVAAQRTDDEVRAAGGYLTLATQAGGADDTARRHVVEAFILVGDKGVARIFALANSDQAQPFREFDRHVFHGVHRDISAAIEHGELQLFHEQALAAHFRQRRIEDHVAARHHRHQFDRQPRMAGFQPLLNILCLPERQRTLPGGNS